LSGLLLILTTIPCYHFHIAIKKIEVGKAHRWGMESGFELELRPLNGSHLLETRPFKIFYKRKKKQMYLLWHNSFFLCDIEISVFI
jgi:hypothetical protein